MAGSEPAALPFGYAPTCQGRRLCIRARPRASGEEAAGGASSAGNHRRERVVELGRILVEREAGVAHVAALAELLLAPIRQRRHTRAVMAAEAAGVVEPLRPMPGVGEVPLPGQVHRR